MDEPILMKLYTVAVYTLRMPIKEIISNAGLSHIFIKGGL